MQISYSRQTSLKYKFLFKKNFVYAKFIFNINLLN